MLNTTKTQFVRHVIVAHMYRRMNVVVCLLCAVAYTYVSAELRLPPTLLNQTAGGILVALQDTDIVLACEAEGFPEPTYKWRHNDQLIETSYPRFEIFENGDLRVRVGPLVEGKYQCSAHNPYGTVVSDPVVVRRAKLSGEPFLADIKEYTLAEGDSLQIPCHYVSDPKPAISWVTIESREDSQGIPVQLSKRVLVDEIGTLYFTEIESSNEMNGRMYQCLVRNSVLRSVAYSNPATISVIPVPPDVGPKLPVHRLHASPSDVLTTEAGTLELRCIYGGEPTPDVSWYRQERRTGKPQPLPPHRTHFSDYNTTLTITDVRALDQGDYLCIADNGRGNARAHRMGVTVDKVPRFPAVQDMPHNQNVTEGHDAVFRCNASGRPEPTVRWTVNGQPLSSFQFSGNQKATLEDLSRKLTIRDVCKDCPGGGTDLGVFQCNASNVHGYAFGTGYLNVLESTTQSTSTETVSATTDAYTTEGDNGCGSASVIRRIRICSTERLHCLQWAIHSSPRSVTVCKSTWWGHEDCVDRCVSDTHLECERHGTKTLYFICADAGAAPTQRIYT